MTKEERAIVKWLASGESGASSETMAFWLGFGIKKPQLYQHHPHDPSDFDRCLRLLHAVPTLRPKLRRMAELSPVWERLMTRWDEIERCHLKEVGLGWSKGEVAERTYELMREIIACPSTTS